MGESFKGTFAYLRDDLSNPLFQLLARFFRYCGELVDAVLAWVEQWGVDSILDSMSNASAARLGRFGSARRAVRVGPIENFFLVWRCVGNANHIEASASI